MSGACRSRTFKKLATRGTGCIFVTGRIPDSHWGAIRISKCCAITYGQSITFALSLTTHLRLVYDPHYRIWRVCAANELGVNVSYKKGEVLLKRKQINQTQIEQKQIEVKTQEENKSPEEDKSHKITELTNKISELEKSL